MATARKKRKKWKPGKEFWVLCFLAISYFVILVIYNKLEQHISNSQTASSQTAVSETTNSVAFDTEQKDVLYVHMIDCGQGDCFLFEFNDKYALIDCGPKSSAENVLTYLKKENVDKLEFIVGTHQHEDHLGGAYSIISNYECGTFYMPKISKDLVTTDWYIQLMSKIKKDKIPVENPVVNEEFLLGNVVFRVVGQLNSKQAKVDLNNYSTVIKVSYGDMDILMTGDAEGKVEKSMLSANILSECEILKVGHHGAETSTSEKFLQTIDPDYALISCETGNKYKHPREETMEKLKKYDVKVFRTDEQGTVVVAVTENSATFNTEPGDYLDGTTVYANSQKG